MKLNLFISIIFLFISSGCNSTNEKEMKAEMEAKSRIKNEDLKKIIPHLLEIHELTFKNVMNYNSTHRNSLFVRFLSSENYVSGFDCSLNSSYYFMEKVNEHPVSIFVDSKSFMTNRYFDLNGLIKSEDKGNILCDEWYYILCKFQNRNGKLILEKITTTFDNSCVDCFYDKSDSTFLTKIGIIIPEPEPIPSEK